MLFLFRANVGGGGITLPSIPMFSKLSDDTLEHLQVKVPTMNGKFLVKNTDLYWDFLRSVIKKPANWVNASPKTLCYPLF